jgi:hypothetical protein
MARRGKVIRTFRPEGTGMPTNIIMSSGKMDAATLQRHLAQHTQTSRSRSCTPQTARDRDAKRRRHTEGW